MKTPAIGSTFEISLRILLMLDEVHNSSLDEQQIGAIDFIAVYAADFGLLDENLHGYGNYRFSEYAARHHLISSALKDLILDDYVCLLPSAIGYRYSITADGSKICKKLTGNYAGEYRIAVRAVMGKFENASAEDMIQEIKRLTVQSLRGGLE